MRIGLSSAIFLAVVSAFVVRGNPEAVAAAGSAPLALAAAAGNRQVTMIDACDGPTFNFFVGPGTCSRAHGVAFLDFIAQLQAHQAAGAWRNAPSQTEAWLGDALVAVNRGGEFHTFTEVAEFGAGVVPP